MINSLFFMIAVKESDMSDTFFITRSNFPIELKFFTSRGKLLHKPRYSSIFVLGNSYLVWGKTVSLPKFSSYDKQHSVE